MGGTSGKWSRFGPAMLLVQDRVREWFHVEKVGVGLLLRPLQVTGGRPVPLGARLKRSEGALKGSVRGFTKKTRRPWGFGLLFVS